MRKLQNVLIVLAVLCFAVPAFAEGGSAAIDLGPIGIGLGIALAAGLCGLGQGRADGNEVQSRRGAALRKDRDGKAKRRQGHEYVLKFPH